MNNRLRFKALFSKKAKQQLNDEAMERELYRTESTSSYMQKRRKIFVNMKPPSSEYDNEGRLININYVPNRVRTAKYTTLSFVPKNLFEQFRNVANLYFLFLVILQCFPLFGVTEPAVSALPLICILAITGIKDGIEDWKRNQSDQKVNCAKTLTLSHWTNVNIPEEKEGSLHSLHLFAGFFCMLAGIDNKFTHAYRMSLAKDKPITKAELNFDDDKSPLNEIDENRNDFNNSGNSSSYHEATLENQDLPSPNLLAPSTPKQGGFYNKVRQRSDTIRTELGSIFTAASKKKFYRPGTIPHSVLHRAPTPSIRRRSSSIHRSAIKCSDLLAGDPPMKDCKVWWQDVQWQDAQVGDYVMIRNDEDIPADIVILSTSEKDNLCYVETQNLDGETNLKVRQGLKATGDLRTVHDCERAYFYFESEPPHANIYQYNGVMKWNIEQPDEEEGREATVSHQKTEAVTYNNLLLRGCVLRNTRWVIGIILFTGDETKIMLNSGKTPSKRSKMAKQTNPYVIANFCLLGIICIISSVFSSVFFNASGSSRYFDYGIEGSSGSYLGFVTFWVTLILYQNIVPISLYISVEIVKTLAAYFIYADIDMYYEPTDTPCISRTWDISDDLGQIEYIFSDKTGTLTQNVMEARKGTIGGVSYGIGKAETSTNPKIDHAYPDLDDPKNDSYKEKIRQEMYDKQKTLFENKYVGPKPTFVDPRFYDDLGRKDAHSTALVHFFTSLALCHTVIAERPDKDNRNFIDYKAQSPDEAALVASARDLGFVFLGREANTLTAEIMGQKKKFELLNVLEFNSTRKRMSVIIKPEDSDKIILLCKGADSVIYERLCSDFGDQIELEKEQAKLVASTSDHLEGFANEGLRTLCLAYRFISPLDYKKWNRRYQEASAAIYNRDEKIEDVCEEIESEMLLMGGTAIEDRLQDGVPETIAELSQSGIKLWVLTGDKTETAINIGFSCNLITLEMELIVVKAGDREETLVELEKAYKKAEQVPEGKRCALVIDGSTLRYALEPKTKELVLGLGMKCSSVLCCRVSPKQKAQVVRLVKEGLNVMTLAIGDGANDVSMIQEANVGIGISGVEGRQAVMASDYAIAQFRFLKKLLIVHGRWSYLRIAEMIMGFFFKNIVWTFVLFWYQIFCQFNGSMMFEYALVALYNVVFTSLPIIFLGIWDQDVSAKISLLYPEMYRMGLRSDKFQSWRFYLTVLDSIYQSTVCFFFPYMLLLGGPISPQGRDQNGMYEIGTIISGISVIVASLFVMFSLYSFTWIQLLVIILSILVYYACVGVYSQFNTFIFAGHVTLFGTGYYWLVLILTVVTCFIPRVCVKHYLHQYHPYDNDIVREQELVMGTGRSTNHHSPTHDRIQTRINTVTEDDSKIKNRNFPSNSSEDSEQTTCSPSVGTAV